MTSRPCRQQTAITCSEHGTAAGNHSAHDRTAGETARWWSGQGSQDAGVALLQIIPRRGLSAAGAAFRAISERGPRRLLDDDSTCSIRARNVGFEIGAASPIKDAPSPTRSRSEAALAPRLGARAIRPRWPLRNPRVAIFPLALAISAGSQDSRVEAGQEEGPSRRVLAQHAGRTSNRIRAQARARDGRPDGAGERAEPRRRRSCGDERITLALNSSECLSQPRSRAAGS